MMRVRALFFTAVAALAASPLACVVNKSSPDGGSAGSGGQAGSTAQDGGGGSAQGGSGGSAQGGSGGSAQDGGGGSDGGACTTLDQDITTDTTLPAGCYNLTANITVTAKLTLQPGVTITSDASVGITIGDNGNTGSLVAVGTASQPIVMKGNGTAGVWNGLTFNTQASGSVLKYVTITDGGRQGNSGDLSINGSSQVDVEHCTFKNSNDDGIWIDPAAVLTGFADNTMTGNQNDPVELYADNVGMLDSASHYTGNVHDRVDFTGTFDAPATIHALDVHYFIGSSNTFYIEAPVVVDPGVTFDFDQGAWLAVHDASGPGTVAGSLKAVGTASKMITFEGNGTPGYWFQIQIMSPDPNNILSYVKVVDAGKDPSNTVAAVALGGNGVVTVNHSIIGNNKGYAFCNNGGPTGDANFTLDSPDSNTYSPANGNTKFCP